LECCFISELIYVYKILIMGSTLEGAATDAWCSRLWLQIVLLLAINLNVARFPSKNGGVVVRCNLQRGSGFHVKRCQRPSLNRRHAPSINAVGYLEITITLPTKTWTHFFLKKNLHSSVSDGLLNDLQNNRSTQDVIKNAAGVQLIPFTQSVKGGRRLRVAGRDLESVNS
jgi:hypothetical protein